MISQLKNIHLNCHIQVTQLASFEGKRKRIPSSLSLNCGLNLQQEKVSVQSATTPTNECVIRELVFALSVNVKYHKTLMDICLTAAQQVYLYDDD